MEGNADPDVGGGVQGNERLGGGAKGGRPRNVRDRRKRGSPASPLAPRRRQPAFHEMAMPPRVMLCGAPQRPGNRGPLPAW